MKILLTLSFYFKYYKGVTIILIHISYYRTCCMQDIFYGELLARSEYAALAGVAQWCEHQPANQRVTVSMPRQGTCPACGPGS